MAENGVLVVYLLWATPCVLLIWAAWRGMRALERIARALEARAADASPGA
jgi:hypothetical protein